MSNQPEQIRPLAPATGSAPTCVWVRLKGKQLCGASATQREVVSGWTYCSEHASRVAEMFGYDQLDAIEPNDKLRDAAQ